MSWWKDTLAPPPPHDYWEISLVHSMALSWEHLIPDTFRVKRISSSAFFSKSGILKKIFTP